MLSRAALHAPLGAWQRSAYECAQIAAVSTFLATITLPHKPPPIFTSDSARAAYVAQDLASTGRQADAFARGVPSARVVRLPNADHYVFNSNEADVLREMRAFIDGLPREKQ
jgi:pimeloyl-ACP methyl ester carboxylesterase